MPAEEWPVFMQALQDPLPTTFRVHTGPIAADVQRRLKEEFVPMLESLPDVDVVPKPLAWYPDGLAWHFNISKKDLRKTPAMKKFHEYITVQNDKVRSFLVRSCYLMF